MLLREACPKTVLAIVGAGGIAKNQSAGPWAHVRLQAQSTLSRPWLGLAGGSAGITAAGGALPGARLPCGLMPVTLWNRLGFEGKNLPLSRFL